MKKEVQAHLERAHQRLKSADLLLNEGIYDDAVSRMYYAVFHSLGAILRLQNLNLSIHKHYAILTEFRKNFVDNGEFPEEMFAKIQNLKNTRENADYSIKTEIYEEEAFILFKDAKDIVKKIEEFIKFHA
jgi:uncharacterized protein (UPF0332 family)